MVEFIKRMIRNYHDQWCKKCGKRYDGDKHGIKCPHCGHINW
jgi:DNA-directed RNA polymerase subunit RPC12/RpoP